MPSFDVAHIHEQGQDMLLFPLANDFGLKTQAQQNAVLAELQMRARSAGLAGQAAAVWESQGRTWTLGPEPWRSFLGSIDLGFVLANVNREISW